MEILKSKSFWSAVFTAMLGLVAIFFPERVAELSPEQIAGIGAVMAGVYGAFLRAGVFKAEAAAKKAADKRIEQ